ncbi:lipid-A-disaccharide kinase [Arcticibacter pallidicorallinus]|uniref:Tetraacyldisaccharide 4'-kinase n=1 Tax=Arcticibacter pallidicorallinus TaxID=1259464 RepID=A0A2T0U9D0_9SPHI|nr:tetraacyldisaccharide 4'-kinase [Arcticibacter pallidicorallinus]PRY54530.1 lipid-A-disaccharide kinase [Arcticibacter pallidicorallinus]
MIYLRLILYPFSLLYGSVLWLRNYLYSAGVFKSRKFDIPVICIGNLALGGAGKSPMAEYLIRLLSGDSGVAVLSRGYGRQTKGFRMVRTDDSSAESGDEPLQFKKKFPGLSVAVCEKRAVGIERLQKEHDLVILDDAYQHRAVEAGLQLLLFDYTRLNEPLLVLPAGNLREPFSGRARADAIILTKTDEELSHRERESAIARVKPLAGQQVFFSYLKYGKLRALFAEETVALADLISGTKVYLLSGIANPKPLYRKISSSGFAVKHYDYPDHHPFSPKNISKLAEDFRQDEALNKIIITTEKDTQRLTTEALRVILEDLPVFYLPVEAEFHESDKERFDLLIKNYVS